VAAACAATPQPCCPALHDRPLRKHSLVVQDHKATDACEKARVEAAGGFVIRKRVMGVLAVARSFGDFVLKKYVPAEPYTSTTKLDAMVGVRSPGAPLAPAEEGSRSLTHPFTRPHNRSRNSRSVACSRPPLPCSPSSSLWPAMGCGT
jgi:hypothetical protein